MTENVQPGKAPLKKPVRNVVPATPEPVEPSIPVIPVKTTTTRHIVSDGEKFEVEVVNIGGRNYLAQSVYKTIPLMNSKRTTQILIAAKGSVIN